MLAHLPGYVPALSLLLADLGEPRVAALALALGVSARTIERWRSSDAAPVAVRLALFWLTRWGRSALDCRLHNELTAATGMVACLRRENEALRVNLALAEALRCDGAANMPALDPGQLARWRFTSSRG